MIYEFEVFGKIVGKQRPRVNTNYGYVYTPTRTKDYEQLIQESFKVKYRNVPMIENRVKVQIIAYIKIAKSTKKSNIEPMLANEISPVKKPDIDNIAKSILDALNNYVIRDDTQVVKLEVEKRYALEEKVYVKIEEF